jgi:lipopolysaccharide export system permease protein
LFINVRTLTADQVMEGVRIYQFDDDQALVSIGEAERGEYSRAEDGWRLFNVSQTLFNSEGTRVQTLPSLNWRSDLTPEVLSVLMVVPERMSVTTLYTYSRHLAENRQKAGRYEIALWKKLVYPFAALVMIGLALPFAYTHDRMGGVSVKVFGGIMIGIGFHLLNGLASNLGVINNWAPPVAALLPSGLFLLAAAGMLLWVEHR